MGLTVQLLALPQHVLDVFGHDGVHLCKVLVQLADVALRARV